MDVAVKEQVDLQQIDDQLTAFSQLFKQNPALPYNRPPGAGSAVVYRPPTPVVPGARPAPSSSYTSTGASRPLTGTGPRDRTVT